MSQGELAILPAGEEQLFDELRRAVESSLHRAEGVADLGLRPAVRRSPLHLRAQVRQGRAQLVTRVGRERLQRAMRAIYALEHTVNAVGERGHLGLPGGTGETGAQLRWSDRAGLGGDALQRPESRIDRRLSTARGC